MRSPLEAHTRRGMKFADVSVVGGILVMVVVGMKRDREDKSNDDGKDGDVVLRSYQRHGRLKIEPSRAAAERHAVGGGRGARQRPGRLRMSRLSRSLCPTTLASYCPQLFLYSALVPKVTRDADRVRRRVGRLSCGRRAWCCNDGFQRWPAGLCCRDTKKNH